MPKSQPSNSAAWKLAFAMLAPIIWFVAYPFSLFSLSNLISRCGLDLNAVLSYQAACTLFWLLPALYLLYALIVSSWLRSRILILLISWTLIWSFFDGLSLRTTIWRCLGSPIKDSLEAAEKCSESSFLPARCPKEVDERVKRMMQLMDEKKICGNLPSDFCFRLMLIGSGERGPVECFRFNLNCPDTTNGTLSCKRLADEPPISFDPRNRDKLALLESKEVPMDLAEVANKIENAHNYYQKNKYRSFFNIARSAHYLLEFQFHGKYYFYEFQGTEPQSFSTTPDEPLPGFLVDLVKLCEDKQKG